MSIRTRIHDWLHEREIDRLAKGCREASLAGDKAKASQFFQQMGRAIAERSPEQVARMEINQGLRARTAIKQRVMHGYGRGLVPAPVVTFVFRLLRLRSL